LSRINLAKGDFKRAAADMQTGDELQPDVYSMLLLFPTRMRDGEAADR
jgi:hypothetical protein